MLPILDTISDFFLHKKMPHHFFTIESTSLTPAMIRNHIKDFEVSYIFDVHYDNFGINDARVLIDLQNEKTEYLSVYIISFTTMTPEAQNALLKVLEEPRPQKVFFFIVGNIQHIIPALQSRTYILYDYHGKQSTTTKIDVIDFLSADMQKRFEIIKSLTDKKLKDEDILSKTDMIHFLNNLELHFYTEKNIPLLEKIATARNYIHAKGASRKMILEDIAMAIELVT